MSMGEREVRDKVEEAVRRALFNLANNNSSFIETYQENEATRLSQECGKIMKDFLESNFEEFKWDNLDNPIKFDKYSRQLYLDMDVIEAGIPEEAEEIGDMFFENGDSGETDFYDEEDDEDNYFKKTRAEIINEAEEMGNYNLKNANNSLRNIKRNLNVNFNW